MRYVIAILGLILVMASLAGVKALQISTLIGVGKQMAAAGPPPEVVSTAMAEHQTWEATLSTVASVVSARGVALSNDAPGMVSRLHFESGASVKKGQVLLELDSGVERAQLASTRVRRKLAERSLGRSRRLTDSGVTSQSQLEVDEASFESLSADANALEAQIDRKVVRAPFSGRLGIRAVNLGQYLAPGTVLTVLESTESVYVDFTLPQQHLASLKPGMLVRAFREKGEPAASEGTISAIEPSVDALTRAVKIRAELPNEDERLRPGMFVNVEVVLPERRRVTVVPATSVVHAAYGDSVFVAEAKKEADAPNAKTPPLKVARQQFVRLGDVRGDFVAVLDGVTAPQEVVTSGAFKLRNGASLQINNTIKLGAELTPRPENN